MRNILQKICDDKMIEVARKKATRSSGQLFATAKSMPEPRGFLRTLKKTAAIEKPALIAEVKKASPSKGLLREDFSPENIARAYRSGGATALSVLSDEPYFKGHETYIKRTREVVSLPVLRKDFIIDLFQVAETRCLEADCLLLIMSAMDSPNKAREIFAAAKELKLDVLVEIHDFHELESALDLSPEMIGVNARDLKTLKINTDGAKELLKEIPDSIFKVAESGIRTHADLKSFEAAGAQAFLVGESLVTQENIEQATKILLNPD